MLTQPTEPKIHSNATEPGAEKSTQEPANRVAQVETTEETVKVFSSAAALTEEKGIEFEDPTTGKGKQLEITTPDGQYFLSQKLEDGTVTLSASSSLRPEHATQNPLGLKGRQFQRFSLLPNGKIWFEGHAEAGSDDEQMFAKFSTEYEKAKTNASTTGRLKSFFSRLKSGKIVPKMK